MLSPERFELLQTQWVRTVGTLGVSPVEAYPVFDKLAAAYTEPHRHYHNLEHIVEMLRVVGRLAKPGSNAVTLPLAVWFHDAVYDPTRHDNEEQSAELARSELANFHLGEPQQHAIRALILATKHHSSSAPDSDVMLDADLAVLASPEARYLRYAEAIQKEYAHVAEADYRTGRTAVLEQFLRRERIFHTDMLFLEGEAQARQNLRGEIERLNSR